MGYQNFVLNNNNNNIIQKYRDHLINRIYKLLPLKEESKEWQSYLDSLILELNGFQRFSNRIELLKLVSNLEGLKNIDDYKLYRKTVFKCIALIKSLSDWSE